VTAVVSTRCRRCGTDLRDRFSRMLGYGPECRKTMTDAQIRAAMVRNTPGHIPAARPASATARRNHAEIARVTAPVVADKQCTHGDRPASCALCRRDNDPWRCAERIIALIQRQRRAERDAAYEAWKAAHAPQPEQLTIGDPT
jgi:hypothetical protein